MTFCDDKKSSKADFEFCPHRRVVDSLGLKSISGDCGDLLFAIQEIPTKICASDYPPLGSAVCGTLLFHLDDKIDVALRAALTSSPFQL